MLVVARSSAWSIEPPRYAPRHEYGEAQAERGMFFGTDFVAVPLRQLLLPNVGRGIINSSYIIVINAVGCGHLNFGCKVTIFITYNLILII